MLVVGRMECAEGEGGSNGEVLVLVVGDVERPEGEGGPDGEVLVLVL